MFAGALGLTIAAAAWWRGRSALTTGLGRDSGPRQPRPARHAHRRRTGCAPFWPFDLTRYFAPWRPIPVSPMGLAYLSPYGLFVAVAECVIFSPAIAFAFWRRR